MANPITPACPHFQPEKPPIRKLPGRKDGHAGTSGGTLFYQGGCLVFMSDCPRSRLGGFNQAVPAHQTHPHPTISLFNHYLRITSTTEPGVPYCQQTPALQDVFSCTANLQVKLPLPPRFPLLHPMKIPADPGNSEPAGGSTIGLQSIHPRSIPHGQDAPIRNLSRMSRLLYLHIGNLINSRYG